jgi:DNA-binding response OmpR family regulator
MKTLLEKPSEKDSGKSQKNPPRPPHNILLVDDELHARELHAAALIRAGYDVNTAKDGADAWNALNLMSYDLLITDNRMPRVTGMELIKKLRSEDMMLPVILASGTVPAEELKRHPWLMLDATLSKPFSVEQLLEVVKQVLRSADNARVRVEKDFPVILKAMSELEPSLFGFQPPSNGIVPHF